MYDIPAAGDLAAPGGPGPESPALASRSKVRGLLGEFGPGLVPRLEEAGLAPVMTNPRWVVSISTSQALEAVRGDQHLQRVIRPGL